LSIEREAVRGLKWTSLAKLGGQTISWGVTVVVFRLLTPDDYGLMALSMAFVSIVSGIAEFGLGSSLIQAATLDQRRLAGVAGALFALNIGCGLVVAFGAPGFADLLDEDRLTAVLRVLSIQFLFTAIEAVPFSIAYRAMRYKWLATVELATTLVTSVGTLSLALVGMGVWALVLGSLAGTALRATLYVCFGGFVRPSFDLRGIGEHVRFGGAVTITRVLWQTTSQADILIGGRILADEVVGLYSVSQHLATLPMSKVMAVINQVAFPAVARLQDDPSRLRANMLHALRLLAVAAIPVMWGLSSVALEFVDVALGDSWHATIVALQVVSLVTPLRMFLGVLATSLTGVGRAGVELRNTVTAAVVLPIAFLLGAQYGLNGLALSWLAAVPVVCALNFRRSLPPLGLTFADLTVAVRAPIIAGAVMYGVVAAIREVMEGAGEIVRLPALIAAGAATYLVCLHVADREIWREVRKLAAALRG